MTDVTSDEHNLTVIDLGRMDYASALGVQLRAVEWVKAGRETPARPEFLLLVEHDPPVITVGRGGDQQNIRHSRDALGAQGVELHESSRGGDVTYHGPGQLVVYPIIDLAQHGRDVHRYLRDLEETVIRLLGRYDLDGRRDPDYTGVWIGREKVCAIGVAITRWVTYHGVALNVTTDLDRFDLIVPCGIHDRGVTSLATLLGRDVKLKSVATDFVATFAEVFGFAAVTEAPPDGI